jgi:hypothetical protein
MDRRWSKSLFENPAAAAAHPARLGPRRRRGPQIRHAGLGPRRPAGSLARSPGSQTASKTGRGRAVADGGAHGVSDGPCPVGETNPRNLAILVSSSSTYVTAPFIGGRAGRLSTPQACQPSTRDWGIPRGREVPRGRRLPARIYPRTRLRPTSPVAKPTPPRVQLPPTPSRPALARRTDPPIPRASSSPNPARPGTATAHRRVFRSRGTASADGGPVRARDIAALPGRGTGGRGSDERA